MAKKKLRPQLVQPGFAAAESAPGPVEPAPVSVALAAGSRWTTWLVFATGLLLSLGFLTLKTWWEADRIHKVSDLQIIDSARGKPVGKQAHTIIVPTSFIDSYEWLFYAQTMVREGPWRMRHTDLDNAPKNREIHWNNGFIWWNVFLGWIYGQFYHIPTVDAIERAAIYSSPLFLFIQILVLGILVTRRYNGWLAAIFMASMIASSSGCEPFTTGYVDHHGEALTCAVCMGLFILMAGAGWVSETSKQADGFALWIPRRQARRWMIASAVMGGAGMWISPFSQVALIFAVLGGAFLAVMIFGRRQTAVESGEEVVFDPSLWRLWGIAGGLSCLGFYMLEYFPYEMQMRLEVNHPLFGIAWWGGAEILYRLSAWRTQGRELFKRGEWTMLAVAAVCAVWPGFLAKFGPIAWFTFNEPFAWHHHATLYEFQPFLNGLYAIPWFEHLRMWSIMPLVLVSGLAFLFWRRLPGAVRGWLLIAELQAVVTVVLFMYQIRWGIVLIGPLQVMVLAQFVVVFYGFRQRRPWVSKALATGFLALAWGIFPGMTLYTIWQDRHPPTDLFPTVSLVLIALFLLCCLIPLAMLEFQKRRWQSGELVACGFLLVTFGTFLGLIFQDLSDTSKPRPINFARGDIATVVLRDIAGKLRLISDRDRPVVLSCPNSSLPLAYFGNLRTLGTNYWNNMEGLKVNAAIYAAQDDQTARRLLRERQVQFIVLFSETQYIPGYFDLHYREDPQGTLEHSFAYRLMNPANAPYWLRYVPYAMPPEFAKLGFSVAIYEVKPD